MKIIQIIPMFGLAGAETMCENLTLGLKKAGQNVIVVSLYDYHSAITERLEKEKIKIIYLNKKNGFDLSIITKLVTLFKQEKPDVVHSHLYALKYVAVAALLSKVKVRIHTVHNIASREMTANDQKLNYLFYHYFHVTPVSLSDEIQKTVIERYHIASEKTPVIYNGIDLSQCIPKTSYQIGEYPEFIHIGRFTEQKNHKMLIRSFSIVKKRIPGAKLRLIGTGELQNEIMTLVHELNLDDSVSFLGSKTNVFPYLHKADVFVLPSIYEGMPMTIIEAMGTGLPIIATDVGGIKTMISNEKNGILTKVEVQEFANAMIRIIEVDNRRKLGENARKAAYNWFSSEQMTSQYINLYRKIR